MCYSNRVRVVNKLRSVAWNATDKVGSVIYWVPIVTLLYGMILLNVTNVTRKPQ